MPKPSIKARELSCLSLDVIVLAPFNPAFSSLSPTGSSGSSRVLAESPSGEPRLYALYNNLLFINLASFDPGTYNVLIQLKIAMTGVSAPQGYNFLQRKQGGREVLMATGLLRVAQWSSMSPQNRPTSMVCFQLTLVVYILWYAQQVDLDIMNHECHESQHDSNNSDNQFEGRKNMESSALREWSPHLRLFKFSFQTLERPSCAAVLEAVPDSVFQAAQPEPMGGHTSHHPWLYVQRVWQSHQIWFPGRCVFLLFVFVLDHFLQVEGHSFGCCIRLG